MGAWRVVGGADPYRAKSESRYEDERSVGKKEHSSSTATRSPLSRYGSGTLGLFHSPGVKFSPLVPLRYPQEKAKVSGSLGC